MIVITGASGFVGRFLVEKLTALKFDVTAVSRNKYKGTRQAYWHYIKDYADTPEGDVIIHLAQDNDLTRVNKSDDLVMDANRILEKLLKKKYRKFIYASSASVYGDQNCYPRRTEEVLYSTNNYTKIKLNSESMVLGENNGIVFRLANLYGPRMSKNNVISTILNQSNQKNIILNTFKPVRDFLWIDDAVSIFTQAVQHGKAGIYNVGTGVGTSIRELADLIQTIIKSEKVAYDEKIDLKKDSTLVLDIENTIKEFNWKPVTNINSGLKKLIYYEKKNDSDFHR